LCRLLGYLGRAESIIEAAGVEGEPSESSVSAFPLTGENPLPGGFELVRLLSPSDSTSYEEWRGPFMESQPADRKPKKSPKRSGKGVRPVPETVFDAMHAETGELQAEGWTMPPGSTLTLYACRLNSIPLAPARKARSVSTSVQVARFALAGTVRPSLTRSLIVAEQVHQALCKISDGHDIFTGTGLSDHSHAHVFPESCGDTQGRVTHVTLYARAGFDATAINAIRALRRTWGLDGYELSYVLLGLGGPDDFDSPLFSSARCWRSVTPFVSTRFGKFSGGVPKMDGAWQVGSDGHDLVRLLRLDPRDNDAAVEAVADEEPFQVGTRSLRAMQFVTRRTIGGGSRGSSFGSAFRIRFSEKRTGPFAFGYGAHFGLGQFLPES
jgi:CRISPR-associated protein Csb2